MIHFRVESSLNSKRVIFNMTDTISFSRFWAKRFYQDHLLIDRLFLYQISIFIAFLAYKLRVTPNQLTIGGCGLATLAGISALFLGTDSTIWPIVVIFVLAQSAFLLDAADGQLARCTNNTSKFGAFLDHGGILCCIGPLVILCLQIYLCWLVSWSFCLVPLDFSQLRISLIYAMPTTCKRRYGTLR